jgi:serine/threonine-protein kinase
MQRHFVHPSGSVRVAPVGLGATAVASLLAVALLAVCPAAVAQSPTDKAAAEVLFEEGRRLMNDKRFAEACPKLADSQRLDPGVGTLLNLALCFKKNGQTASAWSTYREAAAQARTVGQADREKLARDEAASLERTLSRLVIEVPSAVASTPGVEIKRDGAPVPQGLWGLPSPVDPGVRVLEVSAPGKKALRIEVKVDGGAVVARAVVPALEDAGSAPGAPASPGAPAPAAPVAVSPTPGAGAPPATRSGSGQRMIGYVVGGVGVVGLAVGGVFGAMTLSKNEQALDVCPDYPEDACSADDVDRHERFVADAKSNRTLSYVGFGLGGAALLGGIVLIVTAPKGVEGQSTGVRFTPHVARGEVGLGMAGRW